MRTRETMKKARSWSFGVLFCLVCAMLLSGCKERETPSSAPEEGRYLVYYLNSSGVTLSPQEYEAVETRAEALADELMGQLIHVPKDLDCQTPLSEKVAYRECRLDGQMLYLYFDVNYVSMKPEQEILCRAALARTLTQIQGVDYISIYCGDQPLMDRQGNPVGAVAASDFILNTSNVNAYEKTELKLYFADKTGTKLVAETREVVHNINTSMEQLVVEQLLAGPKEEGHLAVLPSECKVLSLSVTDNVCYINFDSAFLKMEHPVNEYLPIYAIVDSLAEMTNITRVQIMVNGSQNVMFRDVVSLNNTFEVNRDYIGEEK